jgi:uncharacterized membrane protein YkoI
MTSTPKRLALAALVLAAPLFAVPAARAEDDGDHDLARDLYEQGQIRALSDILGAVAAQAPGDVVGVEIVRAGARWVYRVQVVAADGQRRTIDVDAGAGVVLPDGDGDDDDR